VRGGVPEIEGRPEHAVKTRDRSRCFHARQNALVLAGWTVLRIDWHQIEGDADAVLAVVEAALAA
jgi:very-short-patch-repair endonuclease